MYKLDGIAEAFECHPEISQFGNLLVEERNLMDIVRRVLVGTQITSMSQADRESETSNAIREAEALGEISPDEGKVVFEKISGFIEYDSAHHCQPRGTLVEYVAYNLGPLRIETDQTSAVRQCYPVNHENERVGTAGDYDFDVGFYVSDVDGAVVSAELYECKFNLMNWLFTEGRVKPADKVGYMQSIAALFAHMPQSTVGFLCFSECYGVSEKLADEGYIGLTATTLGG